MRKKPVKVMTPTEVRKVEAVTKADRERWAALMAKPLNAWRPAK